MIPTTTYNIDWGTNTWQDVRRTATGRRISLTVNQMRVLTEVSQVHRLEELEIGCRFVFNDGLTVRYMDVDESFDVIYAALVDVGAL